MPLYALLFALLVIVPTLAVLSVLAHYMRRLESMTAKERMDRQTAQKKLDEFIHKFGDYDVEIQ